MESMNGTLNSFLGKGRLSVDKFQEILEGILQDYTKAKRKNEKQISLYQKETKVSSLIILFANKNKENRLITGLDK